MPVDVDAEVIGNTPLSADYSVVALAAPAIARAALPGQFVMVKTSAASDPLLRRPYSIFEILRGPSGAPEGISLLNKRVGAGSRLLYDAPRGSRLACLGPLGQPFEPVAPPAEAWMIAGGVGLAPFLSLAESLDASGTPRTLFYGARRATELYYLEAFEQLGVRIVITTEDGSAGERGLITAPLARALAAATPADVVQLYACGPTPMMRAVARLADTYRRPCEVSLEPIMGCGLGGCYSCVVLARDGGGPPHYVRACLEGPVFDAARIVWEELAH